MVLIGVQYFQMYAALYECKLSGVDKITISKSCKKIRHNMRFWSSIKKGGVRELKQYQYKKMNRTSETNRNRGLIATGRDVDSPNVFGTSLSLNELTQHGP